MNQPKEKSFDASGEKNPESSVKSAENPAMTPSIPPYLKKGNRETIQDYYIDPKDKFVSDELSKYRYKNYIRLNVTRIKFTKISFEHCIFDACTLKECVFDTCDFTGCRFINTNLNHSKFVNCKLDYATFDKCLIDDDVLWDSPPQRTNLKLRLARSLRLNYQSIGDARSANNAIHVELDATAEHLKNSWKSEDEYFRSKYPGLKRASQFIRWSEFWMLHFLWGNGESIWKLFRTILIINVVICVYHANTINGSPTINQYLLSIQESPALFLGLSEYPNKSGLASVLTTTSRLISLALLTALLVKRFGRR